MAKELDTVKNRIPCDEWTSWRGNLKGGEKDPRRKDNNSLHQSTNNLDDHFIQLTKKDNAQSKANGHQNRQHISAHGKARAIQAKSTK